MTPIAPEVVMECIAVLRLGKGDPGPEPVLTMARILATAEAYRLRDLADEARHARMHADSEQEIGALLRRAQRMHCPTCEDNSVRRGR